MPATPTSPILLSVCFNQMSFDSLFRFFDPLLASDMAFPNFTIQFEGFVFRTAYRFNGETLDIADVDGRICSIKAALTIQEIIPRQRGLGQGAS